VPTALELAHAIAEFSPWAVQASLRVMRAVDAVPDDVWDMCAELAPTVRSSTRAVESARRFVS
jgi:hypothetical protein